MNIIDDFIKLDMDAPQIDERTEKDLAFNRKVKSCYDMYQWLYKNDILRKEAFLYTENSSMEELEVSFAIDTENLLPYRKKMETSGVKDADLACHYIFGDKGYETSPSKYSGSIFLSWSMLTYRGQLYLIKTMRQRKSLPIRFQRLPAASYMTKRKPNIITPTSIRPSFLLMLFIISRQSFQQRKPYRNTWSAADYILT